MLFTAGWLVFGTLKNLENQGQSGCRKPAIFCYRKKYFAAYLMYSLFRYWFNRILTLLKKNMPTKITRLEA